MSTVPELQLRILMGQTLHLRECVSCGAKLRADRKPASQPGHRCPNCGPSTHVEVDLQGLSALKKALAVKKSLLMVTQATRHKQILGQGRKMV